MPDAARTRENLEGLPVDLIDRLRLAARCADCGDDRVNHPDEEMVRFEWAETARPAGFWYYRRADLAEPSMLRRDHPFVVHAA